MPVTSQLTVRMPDDLRAQLEAAVARRRERKPSLKWNLTEEVLARLGWSFRKEREERRDPTVRALCYLISELAETSSGFTHVFKYPWLRDPFMFRAFKLAIAKVLDALEPSGEVKSPFADLPGGLMFETYKTPESAADFAAASVIRPLFHPSPLPDDQKTIASRYD